jgi:uncharacterized protein (DUF1697 family)
MARYIVLLRGINLGPRNRVSMPELRQVLSEAGFGNVDTYLQSGNVVLSSDAGAGEVGEACRRLIAHSTGLDIAVVVRSQPELAQVVDRNPLAEVAVDPKRYQVSFLSAELDPAIVEQLSAVAVDEEKLVVIGREAYAWHPHGVACSQLWAALAGTRLGVTATARNWTTVTKLLEMASP